MRITRNTGVALAIAILMLGASAGAADGPAYLVANVNQTIDPSEGSDAFGFTQAGRYTFFLADDGVHRDALWRTDGRPDGTILLADVSVPGGPAWPSDPVAVGDKVVFWTRDAIWLSDGTAAGTAPVHDRGVYGFAVIGHDAYFFQDDELWRVDTDTAQAVRVVGLPAGVSFGGQQLLVGIGDAVLFTACAADTGCELWRSDGTAAGTRVVRDIAPGAASGMRSYDYWVRSVVMDGILYFVAEDDTAGAELWRSDGTEAGTRRVKDIRPGPGDAFLVPYDHYDGFWLQLTVADHTLYFVASDGQSGFELWRSDGTAAGTRPVGDLVPGPTGLFDCTQTQGACEPYWSDHDFAAAGDTLFFTVRMPSDDDSETGRVELWRSDGTAGGTMKIEDGINSAIAARDGRVYFTRQESDGTGSLWSRDATASQSTMVANLPAYTALRLGSPLGLAMVNDEPWWSDGTAAGTYLLKDIRGDDADAYPEPLGAIGSTLLFSADDGVHGRELWRTEGDTASTQLLSDIAPGPLGSAPRDPLPFAGGLLFVADDGTHGAELWRSDGSAAGTALVSDVNPGAETSDPLTLTVLGNQVFFFADDGVHGREPWISDGSAAGTHLVRDLRPGREDGIARWISGREGTAAVVGGWVYFAADDGVHGMELWRSDGTAEGTTLVADLVPGPVGGAPLGIAAWSEWVFFTTAPEGAAGNETVAIWRSNGTAAGTWRLSSLPSEYDQFLVSGGSAYLTLWQGSYRGLWRLDTPDIVPHEVAAEVPDSLVDAGGTLLGIRDESELWRYGYGPLTWLRDARGPAAFDRRTIVLENRLEQQVLWTTGGTEESTYEIQRLTPAKEYVNYDCEWPGFTRAGDRVYFAADAGDVGCELWSVPLDVLAESCGTDCPPAPSPTPTADAQTPSPTPACGTPEDPAACTRVVAADVTGARGEKISLAVGLTAQRAPIVGVQADLVISRSIAVPAAGTGRPACTVSPDIDKWATVFAFLAPGCRPDRDCTVVRALVLALDNVDPIADGSRLFTCDLAISAGAATGRHRLPVVNVMASDTLGAPVPALGVDGSVTVLGSGVSRAEGGGTSGCQVVAPSADSWSWIGLLALVMGALLRRRSA